MKWFDVFLVGCFVFCVVVGRFVFGLARFRFVFSDVIGDLLVVGSFFVLLLIVFGLNELFRKLLL